jgi:hypothetical protein
MLIHSLSNCRSANLFYYMKLLMIITPYLLLWLCGATLPVYISPLRDCCVLGVFDFRSSFWLFFFYFRFSFLKWPSAANVIVGYGRSFSFLMSFKLQIFRSEFPDSCPIFRFSEKKKETPKQTISSARCFSLGPGLSTTHTQNTLTHTHTQCNNTPPISLGNFRLLFF